jgi:hypothetical protein
MRRHTTLGHGLHPARADLKFDALPGRTDDCGVDRAVIVLLGCRNVVLEPARHHRPAHVHDTERPVTVCLAVDDDAEPEHVGELLERERLRLHLAKHRVGLLLPALDLRRHALLLEQRRKLVLDGVDQVPVALGQFRQFARDGVIGLLVDVLEGEFLKLLAHFLHAHPTGQRSIDIHGFFGYAGAFFRRYMLQRPHVVQPVGELDQKHPHIIGNRQQQFAQVLGLLGPLGDKIEFLDLCQPFHKPPDILAEQLVDLRPRGRSVLDRVMQQRHRDGGFIEPHLGQDRGNFQRVGDVGVPARTRLLAMFLHGVNVSLVQQGLVDIRFVFLHALHELVLTHHLVGTPKQENAPNRTTGALQSISCLSASGHLACRFMQIVRPCPDA